MFQLRLVSTKNRLSKICLPIAVFELLSLEGKCINFEAGKPKYGGLKLGVFCDKVR